MNYTHYGNAGIPFALVKEYKNYDEMVSSFKLGPGYLDVRYGEYVIISSDDLDHGGEIYRREYNFKNNMGGAKFITNMNQGQREWAEEAKKQAERAQEAADSAEEMTEIAYGLAETVINNELERIEAEQQRTENFQEMEDIFQDLQGIQVSEEAPTSEKVGAWIKTGATTEIKLLDSTDIAQGLGDSEEKVLSQKAAKEVFAAINEGGIKIFFPNGFVQGNVNTESNKFETVGYAIRSADAIRVNGTLTFKINDNFRAYVSYIEDGDFKDVYTVDGIEYYENNSISTKINNKAVYVVISKKDFSTITVDELESVGLEVYAANSIDELTKQIKNLYEGGQPLAVDARFVQGNVNTESNKFETVGYAIRSDTAVFLNSGALRLEMNEGYKAYIAYIEDEDFITVSSTNNTAYFKNGFVSQKIDNKSVYITITKDNLAAITVDELENVGLKIFRVPFENEVKLLSTFAHSRKGARLLPADHSWNTVFEHTGEGVLENMFFAGDFDVKRTKIRITVDDTVESMLGFLYELIGLLADREDKSPIFGNELFGKTGGKNGIYLNYKLPFYKNIKIELANDTDTTNPYVWFNARVSNWHKMTVAGVDIPYGAYFYCIMRNALNVASGEEVELYKSNNNGVITNINMSASGETSSWYQEGMIRAYVGNSTEPQLISSGLEDYFLGTYYFRTGTYHLPVAGCSFIDTTTEHLFSGYRLHTHDLLAHGSGGYRLTVRNSDINVEGASSILNPTLANYRWYVGRYEW